MTSILEPDSISSTVVCSKCCCTGNMIRADQRLFAIASLLLLSLESTVSSLLPSLFVNFPSLPFFQLRASLLFLFHSVSPVESFAGQLPTFFRLNTTAKTEMTRRAGEVESRCALRRLSWLYVNVKGSRWRK